jgi:hypothetical protein
MGLDDGAPGMPLDKKRGKSGFCAEHVSDAERPVWVLR